MAWTVYGFFFLLGMASAGVLNVEGQEILYKEYRKKYLEVLDELHKRSVRG